MMTNPWLKYARRMSSPAAGSPRELLARAQRGCLLLALAIALVVLSGWLAPQLRVHLPVGWSRMKANTALAVVCSVFSLFLTESGRSRWARWVGRALIVFVALLGALVIWEYVRPHWTGIDTLLSADPFGAKPGRMSLPSAMSFDLLAGVVLLLKMRRGWQTVAGDVCACLLSTLVLVTTAGYFFGAIQLFGYSTDTVTAPQTLVCLILLTFVAFGRRAEYGVFGILLGTGIGSNIARFASPFTFILPFVLEIGRRRVQETGGGSQAYTTAIAVSVSSMLAFGLLLLLAWRIEGLEQEISDLTLRDDLTKVYNRRGFQMLATQALLLAERSRVAFSILYIDLDHLKKINDTLGHEMGSSFICEMAELLVTSFRATDVVGRVGGDEFVVAGVTDGSGIATALEHLQKLVSRRNAQPGRAYGLSFSYGHASSAPNHSETLEALIRKADAAMYKMKRENHQSRD